MNMRAGKTARPILNRAYDRHIDGLTELAGRMGWSVPTASKKINNPKSMSLKEAIRLCDLTGYTLDELAKL